MTNEASRFRAWMLDELGQAVLGVDARFHVVYWNAAAERLFGWEAREVLGLDVLEATGGEIDWDRESAFLARLSGRDAFAEEVWIRRRDGERMAVLATISPLWHGDEFEGMVGTLTDLTRRRQLEDAADEGRRRLEEAQRVANMCSFERDVATGDEVWSAQYFAILGLDAASGAEATVAGFASHVHPDDRADFDASMERYVAGETEVFAGLWRVVRSDGAIRWLQVRATSVADELGRPTKIVGTALDVTEREASERARHAAEEQFRLGFERGALGMLMADLDGVITRVNPALCALLGRSEQELLGKEPDDFNHPDDPPTEHLLIGERMLADGLDTSSMERRYLRPDGSVVWAMVDVALVRSEDREPRYFFAQVQDITERKSSEEAFEHLALHDPLTGLPNRLLIQDRLAGALARAQRHGEQLAIVFADVDHFKLVNDTLGHSAGDELLIQLAERLESGIRSPDTVGRFGGDEFVMIFEEIVDDAQANAVGERVMKLFNDPFHVGGQELYVTVSCGVVLADAADTPMTMLRDADAAMYRAKELGRARVELFDQELRSRAIRRLELESSLRQALERGELRLEYQPIVGLADGRTLGVEALLRWDLPGRGPVPPVEFVPVAEQSGLITTIGEWVLDEAIGQVTRWRQHLPGAERLWVSVNLSSRQLSPELPALCGALLEKHGAVGASFGIEITESVVMEDVPGAIEVLRQLRRLGVLAAIDDFGTGYSSLEYLKRLPVRALKIDRSFVDGLGEDPHDSSIVNAVVSLGRALELEPCAEGVETTAQLRELRALGCRYGQGHLWSPALPPAQFEAWFTRRLAAAPLPEEAAATESVQQV